MLVWLVCHCHSVARFVFVSASLFIYSLDSLACLCVALNRRMSGRRGALFQSFASPHLSRRLFMQVAYVFGLLISYFWAARFVCSVSNRPSLLHIQFSIYILFLFVRISFVIFVQLISSVIPSTVESTCTTFPSAVDRSNLNHFMRCQCIGGQSLFVDQFPNPFDQCFRWTGSATENAHNFVFICLNGNSSF